MGRTILAVLAGVVVAWLTIMLCEFGSAAVILNASLIPHPLWMTVTGVLLPLPAAWLGARLAR